MSLTPIEYLKKFNLKIEKLDKFPQKGLGAKNAANLEKKVAGS